MSLPVPLQLSTLAAKARTDANLVAVTAIEGYRVQVRFNRKADGALDRGHWYCDGLKVSHATLLVRLGEVVSVAPTPERKSRLSIADNVALRGALDCIDPSRPTFKGSEAMRAAFSDPAVRLYLTSWCIPKIEFVLQLPIGQRGSHCTEQVKVRL